MPEQAEPITSEDELPLPEESDASADEKEPDPGLPESGLEDE